jgi:hypothetical protein
MHGDVDDVTAATIVMMMMVVKSVAVNAVTAAVVEAVLYAGEYRIPCQLRAASVVDFAPEVVPAVVGRIYLSG